MPEITDPALLAQLNAKPSRGGRTSAPAGDPNILETSKDRDTARNALDMIARIEPQLARVRELYNQNLKGAGPIQSLREYLPSQSNSQFDSATAALQKLVRPATRTPGEGSMSDFESKLAMKAVPDRWSMDGANEESINGLQRFLEDSKAQYSKRIGLPAAPPARRVKAPSGWDIQEVH